MQLCEKLTMLRKQNNLTQEQFAEELSVSRQTISKWERGDSVPDINSLIQIADFYEISLDQLVRDEYGVSPIEGWKATEENSEIRSTQYKECIGKICDISMNSFRYAVIRNAEIIGVSEEMLCFLKNKRVGYVNIKKITGVLEKKEGSSSIRLEELTLGKCTVYVNKGTYFGGMTYLFSSITEILENEIVIKTGKFVAKVPKKDVSVILMKEKV